MYATYVHTYICCSECKLVCREEEGECIVDWVAWTQGNMAKQLAPQTWVNTRIQMDARIHTHMHVYTHTRTQRDIRSHATHRHACMHSHICTHIHKWMHAFMPVHTHAYTHAYVCTHTQIIGIVLANLSLWLCCAVLDVCAVLCWMCVLCRAGCAVLCWIRPQTHQVS